MLLSSLRPIALELLTKPLKPLLLNFFNQHCIWDDAIIYTRHASTTRRIKLHYDIDSIISIECCNVVTVIVTFFIIYVYSGWNVSYSYELTRIDLEYIRTYINSSIIVSGAQCQIL